METINHSRVNQTVARIITNPLRMGYTSPKTEQIFNGTHAAGNLLLLGEIVPSGQIWQVEAILVYDSAGCSAADTGAIITGFDVRTLAVYPMPPAQWKIWTGVLTLSEGDRISCNLFATALNSPIYLRYHARMIEINT